ncbi:MAG: hypothetical protein NVV82_11880 [Sporocytophaga sp.]|nr:hypothetical protein [Sporocytophaga sp.]
MKNTLIIICFLIITLAGFGQPKVLSSQEVDSIFTSEVKRQLNIRFPLFRVYEYSDHSGKHYLVLAEDGYPENDIPKNDSIQGLSIKVDNEQLKTEWSISDFRLKQGSEVSEETSIWFWAKYISLVDIDKDGFSDPIVIYGTSGLNGTQDGRIKILTFYKGAKRAIRHQNGILDSERHTQVDSYFYNLPVEIQGYVKGLMLRMMNDNDALFPNGWEEAMQKKKIRIDER